LSLLSENKVDNKERYRLLLKQGSELETVHVLEQEDAIERFQAKLASLFPSLFMTVAKKRQIAGFGAVDVPVMEELEKHRLRPWERSISVASPKAERQRNTS
jgi:hypothetical protein